MSFDSPLPPYNASDPGATFLASSCFDFLLIELVPMAYRLAHELDEKERDGMAGYAPEQIGKDGSVAGSSRTSTTKATAATGATGTGTAGRIPGSGNAGQMDEDEKRDAVFFRLETLGYRVGQGMVSCVAESKALRRKNWTNDKAGRTLLPQPPTLLRPT